MSALPMKKANSMRIQVRVAMFLVLVMSTLGQLGCGSCPDGTCGAEGQPCHSWTNGCDDDSMGCVNEICTPCGGPGEACCPQIKGADDCDSGSVCDESGVDETPTCTTSCGLPGMQCCPEPNNYPCGDGQCNDVTGLCEGQSSNACGGNDQHYVYIVDPFECVSAQEPFWADPGNAQACADSILASYPPGFTAGAVDADPLCEWSCEYWDDTPDASTGAASVHVCAFSEQQLETCKYSLCTDCLFTDEQPDSCGSQY